MNGLPNPPGHEAENASGTLTAVRPFMPPAEGRQEQGKGWGGLGWTGEGSRGGLPPSGAPSRLRTLYWVAAAALAALIPAVLLAGQWFRSEFAKNEETLETHARGRATALSRRLDAEFSKQIAVLQTVAALPSLDGPDVAAFEAQASRMLPVIPQWSGVGLVEVAGGRLVAGAERSPAAGPAGPVATDALRQAVETRRPAVRLAPSEARAPAQDAKVVLYAPALRDGGVPHVVVAAMSVADLQSLVATSNGAPVLAAVVDDEGRVLLRTGGTDASTNALPQEDLRVAAQGGFDARARASAHHNLVLAAERSQTTGWRAVAAVDRKDLDQIVNQSTWALAGTGLLSLVLTIILGVFLFYNVMERRVSNERLKASRALVDLDARLLATTQVSLAEQRKAASEREVLLREIYHRVKNNLQIIQSLLRLGSRELAPEQREPFENAIRRIGAMARVHTLLYNSPDLGSIDLRDYLDGLVREIADAFGAEERDIRTVLEAESMRVTLDTAVPLAFIAVEILTNAFKHAFPAGRTGTVTVRAVREEGRGVLTVSDDGVGVPPNAMAKRSLGLTIVSKLVQQIGGTLEPPPGGEATFRITFPLESADAGASPPAAAAE